MHTLTSNYFKDLKNLLIFLFSLLSIAQHAQLKNFGTQAKHKPGPSYKYSLYGYYDLVRERGLGFQIQQGNKWNFDVSIYNVFENSDMFGGVQYNYADFSGYGASFKPKYFIGDMGRLYIGANIGFEYLNHPIIWVERSESGGHYDIFSYESAKGNCLNIGATTGTKIQIKNLFVEPFGTIGFASNFTKSTIYYTNAKSITQTNNPVFPIERKFGGAYLHLNIGVKMGISFKDYSQKREAINQTFDNVYIPQLQKLKKQFNEIGVDSIKKYPELRTAYRYFNESNSKFLRFYHQNYNKPKILYQLVSGHLIAIEQKINERNVFIKAINKIHIPKLISILDSLEKTDLKKAKYPLYVKGAKRKSQHLLNLITDYLENKNNIYIKPQDFNNRFYEIIYLFEKSQIKK